MFKVGDKVKANGRVGEVFSIYTGQNCCTDTYNIEFPEYVLKYNTVQPWGAYALELEK
jgi:hypothetical protein